MDFSNRCRHTHGRAAAPQAAPQANDCFGGITRLNTHVRALKWKSTIRMRSTGIKNVFEHMRTMK